MLPMLLQLGIVQPPSPPDLSLSTGVLPQDGNVLLVRFSRS